MKPDCHTRHVLGQEKRCSSTAENQPHNKINFNPGMHVLKTLLYVKWLQAMRCMGSSWYPEQLASFTRHAQNLDSNSISTLEDRGR